MYCTSTPDPLCRNAASIYYCGRPLVKVNSRGTFLFSPDRQPMGEQISQIRYGCLRNKPYQGEKPIMDSSDTERVIEAIQKDRLSVMKAKERWQEATGKEARRSTSRSFFISLDARFGRIRKSPKGKPSQQLYQYKLEKLQELVRQLDNNLIDLYFGDESHICTEGYVPYGWTFPWEEISITSQKEKRLNIFGIVNYDIDYMGFSTTERITTERVAEFLDNFSITIKKETFIVLDNVRIHRSKLMMEMRRICEKRGLYFFHPPYSHHLNIAETLWRILKGKWIQSADYSSTYSLFYAVNRSLAALGTTSFVRFSKCA